LALPAPLPSALLRGRENWLARFESEAGTSASRQVIKEEVQALFARWLRMQNLAVLMGAGASYYVTATLNAGLLDRAARLFDGRRSERTFRDVLQFSSNATRPANNIERFLSQLLALTTLFEAASLPLDRIPQPLVIAVEEGETIGGLLTDLLLDLERAIAVTCNVELPPSVLTSGPGETVTAHENFLSKLMARDPQDGRAKIFTTNYDTLLEQALDRLGILYSDGFTGTVGRRFNPSAYDLDYYYPGEVGEGRVRRYHKVVQLYKLHGSITWRRSPAPNPLNPYGIRYEPSLLKTSQILVGDEWATENRLGDVFMPGEGLGILPTAAKYGQSLEMPFAHMFRSFGQALQQPQTVLFAIGYGGTDDHINQIIQDALVNPGFTCVIVDPSPSTWARRLSGADYCGRVYCVGGEWGRFETLAEYLLPDLEALNTDIAVARTLRELRTAIRSEATITPRREPTEGNENA
jgi:hypothetical protein